MGLKKDRPDEGLIEKKSDFRSVVDEKAPQELSRLRCKIDLINDDDWDVD